MARLLKIQRHFAAFSVATMMTVLVHAAARNFSRRLLLGLSLSFLPTTGVLANIPNFDEVKFRYVKLLPTFLRNSPEDSYICLFSKLEMAKFIKDNDSSIKRISRIDPSLKCKIAYFANDAEIESEVFLTFFNKTKILTITDSETACRQGADIYLFLKGRRIMFSINKARIEEKGLSLNAQFLALAKDHECTTHQDE